jgi:hypothetical protein
MSRKISKTVTCPDWCTVTGKHFNDLGGEGHSDHVGETLFKVQETDLLVYLSQDVEPREGDPGSAGVNMGLDDPPLTAADARAMAAALMKAADLLEADVVDVSVVVTAEPTLRSA